MLSSNANKHSLSPRKQTKRAYVPPIDLRHMNSSKSIPRPSQTTQLSPLFPSPISKSSIKITVPEPTSARPLNSLTDSPFNSQNSPIPQIIKVNRSTSPLLSPSPTDDLLTSPPSLFKEDSLRSKFMAYPHHTTRRGDLRLSFPPLLDSLDLKSIPPSLLPPSVHRFDPLVSLCDPVDVVNINGEYKRQVFPANSTIELKKRDQIVYLVAAVKQLINSEEHLNSSDSLENERVLLKITGRELVRQISVECSQRGALLDALLKRYDTISELAPSIIKAASEEISRRSKLLIDLKKSFKKHEENILSIAKQREEKLLKLINHLELHIEAADVELAGLRANVIQSEIDGGNNILQRIPHPLATLLGEPLIPPRYSQLNFSQKFVNSILHRILFSPLLYFSYNHCINSSALTVLEHVLKFYYQNFAASLVHVLLKSISTPCLLNSLMRRFLSVPLLPQYHESSALSAVVTALVCQWGSYGLSEAPLDTGGSTLGCSADKIFKIVSIIVSEEVAEMLVLSIEQVIIDELLVKIIDFKNNSFIEFIKIAIFVFDSVKRLVKLPCEVLPLPPPSSSFNISFENFEWPNVDDVYFKLAKKAVNNGLNILGLSYLQSGLKYYSEVGNFELILQFSNSINSLLKNRDNLIDNIGVNLNRIVLLQRKLRKYLATKRMI
ncbi:hypothetical protein RCL1_000761 [Eukaryota sp. TZLM3-RCL]